MKERTNREWLADLTGPQRDAALVDLRALLQRGLRYALASRPNVDDEAIEDFVQEALLKILDNLDSFRGESKFTTWAQKIAVNVAFTELRRLRWRDVSLDEMADSKGLNFVPDMLADRSAPPDQQATQHIFLETLGRLIETELTDKQRQALAAVQIQGVPLEEVARRMGSNRNAMYKLLHDARRRLKKQMEAEGLSPEDVLAAFDA
jgi:RNA polymerase sigma-70 factor (ECF subfamily)